MEKALAKNDQPILQAKDLKGDLAQVVKVIGLNAALKLCKEMGGEPIYLPKYERVMRVCRDRMIIAEFDGSNYKLLAKKYGLGVRWVRTIIAEQRKALKGASL